MYLFKYANTIRQRHDFTIGSVHVLRWILETPIEVFRYNKGRFEMLNVKEVTKDGSSVVYLEPEWNDVPLEM